MDGRARRQIEWHWPSPPLSVALIHPEIPPNTGNVARLCAATGTILHLVEPLGFRITDRELKRAGLDYWPHVDKVVHANLEAFVAAMSGRRLHLFSTTGARSLYEVAFQPGDVLVFGRESAGLPESMLRASPDQVVNIPQRLDHVRSLNLSTSVGIAVYEALRQLDKAAGRGLESIAPG
jgi:tRNA (cytidine/uridine-2'-O-)-methyltransferase